MSLADDRLVRRVAKIESLQEDKLMLLEEARWLNRHLSKLSPNDLYPMCNIGSSTEHYRQVEQPYIEK